MKNIKIIKRSILFAFLLVSSHCFISCEKNDGNNQPITSDSTYLSKYYWIRSYLTTPDTLMSVIFYDSRKRVLSVHDSNVTNGTSTFFAKKEYFYIGNDTLPYKSQLLVEDGSFIDSTTKYYFYDVLGRRVKDSTVSRTRDGIPTFSVYQILDTYQYSSGRILANSTKVNLANNHTTIAVDTAYFNLQNNITESIGYSDGDLDSKFFFSYDNNPTAFERMNINITKDIIPRGSTYHDLLITNNQTYIKEERYPSNTIRERFITYSYDAHGKPTELTIPNSTNPSQAFKMTFVYSD